jgi:hypothetical protein
MWQDYECTMHAEIEYNTPAVTIIFHCTYDMTALPIEKVKKEANQYGPTTNEVIQDMDSSGASIFSKEVSQPDQAIIYPTDNTASNKMHLGSLAAAHRLEPHTQDVPAGTVIL